MLHFALITFLELLEGLGGYALFAFVIGAIYAGINIIGKRNAEKLHRESERRTNRIIEDLRAKERRSKEIRVFGGSSGPAIERPQGKSRVGVDR